MRGPAAKRPAKQQDSVEPEGFATFAIKGQADVFLNLIHRLPENAVDGHKKNDGGHAGWWICIGRKSKTSPPDKCFRKGF
jgi:hypothetical protein